MSNSRVRGIAISLGAIGLALAGSHAAEAGGAQHQDSAVYRFDNSAEVGAAHLTRNKNGVTMNLWTSIEGALEDFGVLVGEDWTSGDATTVWFVVFNDPGGCIDGCGEDDVLDLFLGADRAEVGILRAAGHVAGGAGFNASARLNEGDGDELFAGTPLQDAMGAEIHLVVRSHGPAATLSGPELAAALHSIDGGCGTNTCGDSQFAVFLPPGA